jgi:hypothetical protein
VRVVDDQVVYRNPNPNHRPETVSGSTLAWSRLDTPDPILLGAFRSGSAKMSPDGRVKLRASRDLGRTWDDVPSPFAVRPAPGRLRGRHDGADGLPDVDRLAAGSALER